MVELLGKKIVTILCSIFCSPGPMMAVSARYLEITSCIYKASKCILGSLTEDHKLYMYMV